MVRDIMKDLTVQVHGAMITPTMEELGVTTGSTNWSSGGDSDSIDWVDTYDADLSSPLWIKITILVILWVIGAMTVVGNILVITAFIRDRELRRKPANLFILNLSVSDLLIGLISIPFFNIWTHTETWEFGEVGCKLWNITDYTATTQSSVAIVLISFDRLILVTKGLNYRKFITLKLTCFLIVASWLWSFSLNSIPILCSDIFLGPWVIYTEECDFGIFYLNAYKIIIAIFAFVIPFLCLSIFNIIVYNNIRSRSQGFRRGRTSGLNGSAAAAARSNSQARGTSEYRKHRKAAITLALIVGVFLICSLPWYVYKLVTLIASDLVQERKDVMDALACMLYANSAINPFLYAVTHPRIRAGLIACIMCCIPKRCQPSRARTRPRAASDDQTQRIDRQRHRETTEVTRCINDSNNTRGSSV